MLMLHQEIAKRLREAILRHPASVRQIARHAGIPQQVLQRFVAGTRENLRLDTATKLMSALGFAIVDRESVQSMLARIDSTIVRWEGIRRHYGAGLPRDLDEVMRDVREVHSTLQEAMPDDARRS